MAPKKEAEVIAVPETPQPAPAPEPVPAAPQRVLKTYYVATEGLDVHYGAVTGDSVMSHMRGVISFARGTYTTDDPEKQAFLDKYPGCISEEAWRESHIPPKEREEQKKRENERLQAENNRLRALLEQQGK